MQHTAPYPECVVIFFFVKPDLPRELIVEIMPLQHTATHFNSLRLAATRCDSLQHTAARCNTLQHAATHFNLLRLAATRGTGLEQGRAIATHCNTLQHTATHCNTLQHTATHCNSLQLAAAHMQDGDILARERTIHLFHICMHGDIIALRHTGAHCNSLLHIFRTVTRTHCSTHARRGHDSKTPRNHHIATHCITL